MNFQRVVDEVQEFRVCQPLIACGPVAPAEAEKSTTAHRSLRRIVTPKSHSSREPFPFATIAPPPQHVQWCVGLRRIVMVEWILGGRLRHPVGGPRESLSAEGLSPASGPKGRWRLRVVPHSPRGCGAAAPSLLPTGPYFRRWRRPILSSLRCGVVALRALE